MTKAEKLQQVENVIQLLHLTKCADTIIGNERVRGISGGERKRVSIAAELLTDPSVILLDEPTSGLGKLSKEHASTPISVTTKCGYKI